jgi:anti-sigma factor RsiW
VIEEFRDRIGARMDGELAALDAAAVDAHLAGCAECTAYAGELSVLRELTLALPREPAPATLPVRVAARIRAIRRRRWVWRLAPVPVFAAAVAAGLLALPATVVRAEERRVGEEWPRKCTTRCARYPSTNNE